MKKLLLVAGLIFSFTSHSQFVKVSLFVARVHTPEKVFITNEDLSQYVNHHYHQKINISDFVIEQHNKKWFLLAYDKQQGKTFALRLVNDGGRLETSLLYTMSSCDCDCLDLSKFKIERNRIVACKDASHSLYGKF